VGVGKGVKAQITSKTRTDPTRPKKKNGDRSNPSLTGNVKKKMTMEAGKQPLRKFVGAGAQWGTVAGAGLWERASRKKKTGKRGKR